MMRIIPSETYRFIESKLHGYAEIKREIEEWELSVIYPENRQLIPGTGYISDPTANQAIRLANRPEYIINLQKWVDLIDKTREFCRRRKNRIFDVWYGKERQTATRAYTRNGISKLTFKKNRNGAVYFLLIQSMNAGLCKLYNNTKDENAAI